MAHLDVERMAPGRENMLYECYWPRCSSVWIHNKPGEIQYKDVCRCVTSRMPTFIAAIHVWREARGEAAEMVGPPVQCTFVSNSSETYAVVFAIDLLAMLAANIPKGFGRCFTRKQSKSRRKRCRSCL